MEQIIDIIVTPEESADHVKIERSLRNKIQWKGALFFIILKRSIDARSRNIKINLRLQVADHPIEAPAFQIKKYPSVKHAPRVAIMGAGPAGLFAALTCIELGMQPVLFERGKNIRDRRRDLAMLNQQGIVNGESNYCFGEGGAGTYSDGKLYTRSDKRGNIREVLETFVRFGADPDILVDAHPHIGTNKLPKIIEKMRATILDAGGEIYFNAKVTDIQFAFGAITGLVINNEETYPFKKIILATGHSARDIFELLAKKNIQIEAKPFALGVRIEHPQQVIDKMQYHCDDRGQFLPPSSYSIVQQVNGKGVYSFCMCPGGIIAPCATAEGEIVTNGWSPSKRNNPFANSGFVVSVELNDLGDFSKYGALAAMEFQRAVEQTCFAAAGGRQRAPAQRMVDFVQQKTSASLPACSYHPGIVSVNLHTVLPDFIAQRIKDALQQLQSSKPVYFTNEAVLVAPESRTSSPVKIPRDPDTFQHPQIKGLYPCGEGAGYAGGIVSAAMDGIRVAQAVSGNR